MGSGRLGRGLDGEGDDSCIVTTNLHLPVSMDLPPTGYSMLSPEVSVSPLSEEKCGGGGLEAREADDGHNMTGDIHIYQCLRTCLQYYCSGPQYHSTQCQACVGRGLGRNESMRTRLLLYRSHG